MRTIDLESLAIFRAVVEEILILNKSGQPLLVGTISVEKSERLSAMLSRRGDEALVRLHDFRVSEFTGNAKVRGEIIGADHHDVDTFHSRDAVANVLPALLHIVVGANADGGHGPLGADHMFHGEAKRSADSVKVAFDS